MQTYISSKEELVSIVNQAVKASIIDELPKILRDSNQKEYITPKELEENYGIKLRQQQYLRDKKRIPFHKQGKKVIYKVCDIEAYYTQRKIDAR